MEIRSATPKDAAQLTDIYGYYVKNTAVSLEWEVPSLREFKKRIKNTLKNYPYLVAVQNGKIAGYCYAGAFKPRKSYRKSCEVSIYVEKSSIRQGLGKALYSALEAELINRGFENLYAFVVSPVVEDEYLTRNSEDFHTHSGYKTVGKFYKCAKKFNTYYNVICMEKLLTEK